MKNEIGRQEMEMFGFSPENPGDIALWKSTEPQEPTEIDYSNDQFEFGGIPRQDA